VAAATTGVAVGPGGNGATAQASKNSANTSVAAQRDHACSMLAIIMARCLRQPPHPTSPSLLKSWRLSSVVLMRRDAAEGKCRHAPMVQAMMADYKLRWQYRVP
jgi:hypothetical protein